MNLEIYQQKPTEMKTKRTKNKEKITEYPRTLGCQLKSMKYAWNARKRRQTGVEEIFETVMIENFSQINVRHQITDSGNSEYLNRKNAKIIITWLLYFEYVMLKSKKKILKQVEGKILLTYGGSKIRKTSNFSETRHAKKRVEGNI